MDIFTRFKTAIKIREVVVDNHVFQLHYRVTAILLLGCAALVASKQHFGDPIDCITRDDVPNKIMDTYCWIHATFTLPSACNKTIGFEVAHPCVDSSSHHREERVYHKYYQWVYFVLFFQAAFFYAPHFFWKSSESRLLRRLCEELKDPLYNDDDKLDEDGKCTNATKNKANRVVTYLVRNRLRHQQYFRMFALFEVCNFLNVILQMYVVDEFLGGTFTTYGLDVLNYSQMEQDDRMDPMVRVFPRMTKCTFHRFGSSGDIQRYDALCILPLNIINEKIYIIMWFWFVFLAIVSGLWLVYRFLTFTQPKFRYQILYRRARLARPESIKHVLGGTHSGDWFLLYMMCRNVDSQWFRFIMSEYSKELKKLEEAERAERNANRMRKNSRNNYTKRENGAGGKANRSMAASGTDLEQGSLSDEERDNGRGPYDDDNVAMITAR